MKISQLAEASGVSVATLKYYLREGLLHSGQVTSRTQASYDDSHLERIRLVRALTEVGGLSLAATARVLQAISAPSVERLGVLGAAQRSLLGAEFVDEPSPTTDAPPDTRARRFVQARGWRVDLRDPVLDDLDRAWQACEDAHLGVDERRMAAYADSVEAIARIDVGSVPATPVDAARHVVLGTVLVDPVLSSLRRLAQQHVAVRAETAT